MNKVIIIAEAGVNHNGSLKALELVDVAADAGADFVKFQTFQTALLVHPNAQKAAYQKQNMNDGETTQYNMLKKLELSEQWYPVLIDRCHEKGIKFLSTGFDELSVDLLAKLDLPFYKIPSGEITNKPLLQHISRKGKTILLSTGMSDLSEVRKAVEVIEGEGLSRDKIIVLHCNTEYPTSMRDVNLLAMLHISRELNVAIGYSDHTLGIEVPIASVALGASVIEKHFTLDRNLDGPDHAASLLPSELKAMVSGIRNIEEAISGSGLKEVSKSEKENILIARKSLFTRVPLKMGRIIQREDIVALRPAVGISPMDIDIVIGKRILRDMESGESLKWKDLGDD